MFKRRINAQFCVQLPGEATLKKLTVKLPRKFALLLSSGDELALIDPTMNRVRVTDRMIYRKHGRTILHLHAEVLPPK
jgi:hypothetical protein